MRGFAITLVILPLLLAACSSAGSGEEISATHHPADLTGHWVHAYERDAGGVEVYRAEPPESFPPSRFRGQYVLEAGGTCRAYVLAPDDGHYFAPCTWRLDADRLHITAEGDARAFRVVRVTADELRLAPID